MLDREVHEASPDRRRPRSTPATARRQASVPLEVKISSSGRTPEHLGRRGAGRVEQLPGPPALGVQLARVGPAVVQRRGQRLAGNRMQGAALAASKYGRTRAHMPTVAVGCTASIARRRPTGLTRHPRPVAAEGRVVCDRRQDDLGRGVARGCARCARRQDQVVATGSQAPAVSTRTGRSLRRVAGVVAGGLLTGWAAERVLGQGGVRFGWPQGGITPQSDRMFNLWIGSAIAALAVGVFVWGLIFWCVIRYRKRGDALPPQTRYNLPIELIYSVAPFLIISVLFYYTAVVQTDVNRSARRADVVVRAAVQVELVVLVPRHQGRDGQPVSTVGVERLRPCAGRADEQANRVRWSTRPTSSTRSGCRSCCSSGTSFRATWSTGSRPRS